MNCLNCGLPFDPARFPLARPRADGSRHPFRYCDSCLARPQRVGGGRAALLTAKATYRARRLIRLPGVCIDCRAAVVWNGKRWLEAPVGRGTGRAHRCVAEQAA